jgi:hypothetical protein
MGTELNTGVKGTDFKISKTLSNMKKQLQDVHGEGSEQLLHDLSPQDFNENTESVKSLNEKETLQKNTEAVIKKMHDKVNTKEV